MPNEPTCDTANKPAKTIQEIQWLKYNRRKRYIHYYVRLEQHTMSEMFRKIG